MSVQYRYMFCPQGWEHRGGPDGGTSVPDAHSGQFQLLSYLVRHRLKLRAAEALPALWALVRPQPSPVAWPAY